MTDEVVRWLVCGASAGMVVDLSLYPLDTVITRLQSKQGLHAAGGFNNIYRGFGSVLIGSAPIAAIFLATYRVTNHYIGSEGFIAHTLSAGIAENVACILRVPTEIVKQRSQATHNANLTNICREVYQSKGFIGFYRGYLSTLAKEVPYSMVEFPIWELLKQKLEKRKGAECSSLESAFCGSIAGGVAAVVITPMDVTKTRIMLSHTTESAHVFRTMRSIAKESGIKALYAGVFHRIVFAASSSFLFFFAYETVLKFCNWAHPPKDSKEEKKKYI